MDEKIEKIKEMMEAGRSDVVGFLAADLFLKGNEVNEQAKIRFQEITGFKVVTGKTMGMLAGYILAENEKWYFG